MTITVTFRGYQTDVVVDQYDPDPETNSCDIEWHFDGLSPDEHADLHVSSEEDDAIIEQIHIAMVDYR